jgi:hypothetical protein
MTHTIRPLALLGALSLAACGSGANAGSPDASGPGSDASSGGSGDSGGGASSGGSASGASSSGGGTSSGASSSGGGSSGGGDSGPSSGGADGGSSSGSDGGAALVNHAPGSKFFVGANFWNIDWEGQADFFTSNVDFTTTTNPWQPALLTDLAPYAVLRFMDWNQTNTSSNAQAVWSTRKQKTQPQNEPVAFEWQIDLCNRTKKDYWLNIPHEAAPDYWPKLAQLVHDQLDPSLRVYVEWSNEVWNTGFPQHAYSASQAQTIGLPGATPAIAYQVYESVRVYEAFEGVFGKGSPRLVKVIAGQAAWTGPCNDEMTAFASAAINPNKTAADAYAMAPYFSGTTIQALGTSITTVVGWTQSSFTCASGGGLALISYEGGSDSFAASGNGCTTLQHDPGMHDLYTQYLTGISGAKLSGPFMQYTHTGACWGLKEKTSDALSVSPKYKGVLDWLAAHP